MSRLKILGLFLAFGCAHPFPKIEPLPLDPLELAAGEWRVIDHIIVITDASFTMSREALLPEATALTRSILAGMPPAGARAEGAPGYQAGLIGFGGDERIRFPLSPVNRPQLLVTAARLRPLGEPPFGGSTPLTAVIGEVARALAAERGPAALVIIGDGLADRPEAAVEATRKLVSERRDPVCIHAIHSGDAAEGRALFEQLARLSSHGCGSFRTMASLADVRSVQDFERRVFVGRVPLPEVAAAPPARDPCAARIVLRGVTFDLDRAVLRPDSAPVLDFAAEQLRACSGRHVTVEGHTCALGPDGYNQQLSERRAAAVRDYLLAHGVASEQLTTRGLGKSSPVASNERADGRAQNRRVELVPGD